MANMAFSLFDTLILPRPGQNDQQVLGRKVPIKNLMNHFMKWKSVILLIYNLILNTY